MNQDISASKPAVSDDDVSVGFRRLFHAHVAALVVTALVVIPLLLGVAAIPSWVSVAYCAVLTTVALAFVVAAVHVLSNPSDQSRPQRLLQLSVVVGLSLAQVVFVSTVLICVYTPELRL